MQVEAACEVPWLEEVILDFLEVHGLRKAVAAVKAAHKRCVVATPRILKPGEERLAAFYLRLQPHALLLRSAGLLWQLSQIVRPGMPCILDVYLELFSDNGAKCRVAIILSCLVVFDLSTILHTGKSLRTEVAVFLEDYRPL